MPIFALTKEIAFPPPELTGDEGILAMGGDLSPKRLLLAYEMGIFPWYSTGEPIMWWCPDPRFVLFPEDLKVSKNMRKVLKKELFTITYDRAFPKVIDKCKRIFRKGQFGTWITPEMQDAYIEIHKMGYAHSVEVWQDNKLVGGLYGVSLGKCFFGESMFAEVSDASKAGFITLVETLRDRGFQLIDCQVYTDHLARFGAVEISREDFLEKLKAFQEAPTLVGNWGKLL